MLTLRILFALLIGVAGTANAEMVFPRATYGFSAKEWSALSVEIRRCHSSYGPYAADLGRADKLARCLKLGGYTALIEAETAEARERAATAKLAAETAKADADAARKRVDETQQAIAAKAKKDRESAAQAARDEETARLAARTPAEVEADRKAEERRAAQMRADEELRAQARAAAAHPERLKERAMETARNLHKDPDSVRFSNVRVVTDRRNGKAVAVCGNVSGTNSFGARVSGRFVASMDSDHVYLEGPNGWGSGSGLSIWSEHCT